MIAKFVLTTEGEVKPLVASSEQWEGIRSHLKLGATAIHGSKGSFEIFAVLEVAKGFEGKGISSSKDGIMMIFSKTEEGKGE